MKRIIACLIFAVLTSSVAISAPATAASRESSSTSISAENSLSGIERPKKRKLKKKLRQAGRAYKLVKSDRKAQKKAREVQKKIRRVINIW